MAVDKKLPQNDEIDLVDLLGVVIKHRKFIFWFVVIVTLVSALFLAFREYRNLINVGKVYKLDSSIISDVNDDGYKLDYALDTYQDSVLVTYMFLKKGAEQDLYTKFISLILYPSTIGAPSFQFINKKDQISTTYLFRNEAELKDFISKYNAFVTLLTKVYEYRLKLGDEAFSTCRQFASYRSSITEKNLFLWFKNNEDMKYCNLFNYYYNLLQGRISYALDNIGVPEAYIPFIIDFMGGDTQKLKLIPSTKTRETKNQIKMEPKVNFNKKKVLKYSLLALVLTAIFSFFLVFVLEFWKNNRSRLNNYWKKQ